MIKITLTSFDMERNILRKFSAWMELLRSSSTRSSIFVKPSIISATTSPNISRISSNVYSVSSTTSCSRAHTTEVEPKFIS